jgi:hypothetical protein
MQAASYPARKPNIVRVLWVTAALLPVPALAMLLTTEVRWGAGDFAAAAVLLAGSGLAHECAMARLRTRQSRLMAGFAIAFLLLTIWAELAVGIFH